MKKLELGPNDMGRIGLFVPFDGSGVMRVDSKNPAQAAAMETLVVEGKGLYIDPWQAGGWFGQDGQWYEIEDLET